MWELSVDPPLHVCTVQQYCSHIHYNCQFITATSLPGPCSAAAHSSTVEIQHTHATYYLCHPSSFLFLCCYWKLATWNANYIASLTLYNNSKHFGCELKADKMIPMTYQKIEWPVLLLELKHILDYFQCGETVETMFGGWNVRTAYITHVIMSRRALGK